MKQIIRILFSGIIGGITALGLVELEAVGAITVPTEQGILRLLYVNKEIIVFIMAFALIYMTIGIPISQKIANKIESALSKYPMQEILMYIIGLAIGLGVANMVKTAFALEKAKPISNIFIVLLYLGLGCFGIYLVHIKKEEIKGWISKKGEIIQPSHIKLLDTSVIIDGRILDIIQTGFIEGKIIIPSFVLDELRHIADSSDSLKRNRGRRGLDLLNELKAVKNISVEILDIDYSELDEVDSKLLKLASQLQGKVVTNDFNLNKVAKIQKVQVLNINDLANAVKPILLPNEELVVTIVKEGKEQEQGLAYLNDGTMIVVEGGKKYVGTTIQVLVTTTLQTSAGRMIFAKVNQKV
ncbi:PIN/TRAM domain-containing protein [Sporanaerobium hydrogeniformans]|uniref:PIN/TRAM domain-containing protein n=1 Tax=Sporanaerobium hydrogeniformans TaxID=3072179 RepID=A0AC61DE87_9FIRM|nr:PIN domain-containing protein [Sporanaerobium hydrogeniformans]PHV71185.1 PIN/TRAM domain-containing protein [Sporanaerobium hydrogeniformans]